MSAIRVKDPRTQQLVDQAMALSPSEPALMAWFQSLSPDDRERMNAFIVDFTKGIEAMWHEINTMMQAAIDGLATWYADTGIHVYEALVASGGIAPPDTPARTNR